MQLHPMVLVTITCEAAARTPVLDLLHNEGAQGWTLFPVEGEGAKGLRLGDIPESANLQIQVIVRPDKAEAILQRLHAEYFPLYTMIAFVSEVRVLRPGKF